MKRNLPDYARLNCYERLPPSQKIYINDKEFLIHVLRTKDGIFLTEEEGLGVVGTHLDWMKEIKSSKRKMMYLRRKGFSQIQKIYYAPESRTILVTARPWGDWLIIWEYLAYMKNTKALLLLRLLASMSQVILEQQ